MPKKPLLPQGRAPPRQLHLWERQEQLEQRRGQMRGCHEHYFMFLLNGSPEQSLPPWRASGSKHLQGLDSSSKDEMSPKNGHGRVFPGAGSTGLRRMIKARGVWPRVGATPGFFVGKFRMDGDEKISLPCRDLECSTQNLLFCRGVEDFSGVLGVLGWGLVSFCVCLFVCLFPGFFWGFFVFCFGVFFFGFGGVEFFGLFLGFFEGVFGDFCFF